VTLCSGAGAACSAAGAAFLATLFFRARLIGALFFVFFAAGVLTAAFLTAGFLTVAFFATRFFRFNALFFAAGEGAFEVTAAFTRAKAAFAS